MRYKNIREGRFLSRPNRFIARVEIDGLEEICHVKNTGRCRELLVPGASVFLEKSDKKERKTAYDLIAVKKGNRLILCVWDNGPGIPEPILTQIRERRVPGNTGIGLLNIEERIQMLGEPGSGLKIYSAKGRGTWITLCICQPGGECS